MSKVVLVTGASSGIGRATASSRSAAHVGSWRAEAKKPALPC